MAEQFDASIIVNILSRVPADWVLTCKSTCKTWESLINDPYFVESHTHRLLLKDYNHSAAVATQDDDSSSSERTLPPPPRPLSFLFLVAGRHASALKKELYTGEYCYEGKRIMEKQLNCPPIESDVVFAGSCNGLVCLAVPIQYGLWDPIYIFNPITREYVNLPRFSKIRYLNGEMAYGFGYHQPTQKYKVVRIFYGSKSEVGQLQVYTLGNPKGKWRKRGSVLYSVTNSRGIPCNGALHWFAKGWIVSFDLGDEEFRMVPTRPPFDVDSSNRSSYGIGELNGCLFVTHKKHNEYVDLWTMRKKKINQRDDVDEYFWNKDFRIECESNPWDYFLPVSISENRRKLLLWYGGCSGTDFVAHNKKYPKSLKLLDDDYNGLELGSEFLVIPYIKSFISLRALGENTKLMDARGSVEFMNVRGDATKPVPLRSKGSQLRGDDCEIKIKQQADHSKKRKRE